MKKWASSIQELLNDIGRKTMLVRFSTTAVIMLVFALYASTNARSLNSLIRKYPLLLMAFMLLMMINSMFSAIALAKDAKYKALPLNQAGNSSRRHKSLFDCFLTEQMQGDLLEEREELIRASGKPVAYWWYYHQIFASLWPQLCGLVRRVVTRTTK